MHAKLKVCLFTALLFSAFSAAICKAVGPVNVTLQEKRPREFFGRLYVGGIEDKAEKEIPFRMMNPSNTVVVLRKPTGTCGCVRVEMSSAEIEPGRSVDGVLFVQVDAKRMPIWRQQLFFDGEEQGDASVELEVVSEIVGMLAFKERDFLVTVFDKSVEKSIRDEGAIKTSLGFTVTHPLDISNLRVEVEPAGSGAVASIHPVGKQEGEVRLTIDARRFGKARSLLCRVTDRNTGVSADIRGVVARRSPISVVPSVVRLSAGQGDDGLVGTAIVARHVASAEDSSEVDDAIVIKAHLLETSLNVKSKRSGRNVSRVSFVVPEVIRQQLLDERNPILRWDIIWGKERALLKSSIHFDRNAGATRP